MRVRIVRGTVGDGGRALAVGEVLTLSDHEAQVLVGYGKAEVVADVPDGTPPVRTRDPVVRRTRGVAR